GCPPCRFTLSPWVSPCSNPHWPIRAMCNDSVPCPPC
nr:Chain A, xm63 [Peptide display vector fth1]